MSVRCEHERAVLDDGTTLRCLQINHSGRVGCIFVCIKCGDLVLENVNVTVGNE